MNLNESFHRHSRESGNPVCKPVFNFRFKTWIPAFAGMTVVAVGLLFILCGVLRAETPLAQKARLQKADFEQRLDAALPLDARFLDEHGRAVALGDYFGSRPVLLVPVYFRCPQLCSETLNGLVRALRSISFDAGKQFQVVVFSFDAADSPAAALEKKRQVVQRYGRPDGENGWAFLTGDETSIRRLTDAIGFHFSYDDELKQFAHSTGVLLATPGGRVSHYFYGVEYSAKDLRLAMVEASNGKIGSPVDKILLYCYSYNPVTGKYGLLIQRVVRLAAAATVLLLALVVGVWLWRERKRGTA
jgi:protein SCO1/2